MNKVISGGGKTQSMAVSEDDKANKTKTKKTKITQKPEFGIWKNTWKQTKYFDKMIRKKSS